MWEPTKNNLRTGGRTMKLSIILTLLLVFGLTACDGSANGLGTNTWVLESYGDEGNQKAVIEDTEVTAIFDEAESRVSGSAGCNGYFGGYEKKGNQLTFGPLANTEMYCADPEGVMDQELDYLKLLGTAKSYEIEGSKLHIFCAGGNVLNYRVQ
jgi:heat shock protein HslJ